MISLKLNLSTNLKFILIAFTILVVCFLIIDAYSNKSDEKALQITISLYDENRNEFLQLRSQNDSATFYLDVSFLSNYDASFQVYLLSNFMPISFSLNDGPKKIMHELLIHPSNELSISQNNKVSVDGLTNYKNDLCFVLVSNVDTFTKRFVIVNKNSNLSPKYPILQLNTDDPWCSVDGSSYNITFDKKSNKLHVLVDFMSSLNGNRYQGQFNDAKISFDVAVVILVEPDNKFYNLGIANVDEKYIEFQIPPNYILNCDSIRIMVFPFTNQYDDSFLSTYKVSLWSAPICTSKINIESGI